MWFAALPRYELIHSSFMPSFSTQGPLLFLPIIDIFRPLDHYTALFSLHTRYLSSYLVLSLTFRDHLSLLGRPLPYQASSVAWQKKKKPGFLLGAGTKLIPLWSVVVSISL